MDKHRHVASFLGHFSEQKQRKLTKSVFFFEVQLLLICESNRFKLTVMVEFEEMFQVRVLQPLQEYFDIMGGLAQLARALDLHSRGQGFDSPILHKIKIELS